MREPRRGSGKRDRVDGTDGPQSRSARPGDRPPAWLDAAPRPGRREPMSVAGVDVEVWEPAAPAGRGAAMPLLLVHDGPEMDALARVTHYAGSLDRPVRVALLSPGDARDERYAANPAYAATLVDEVLPALRSSYPTVGRPVLAGASLGALAALHAAWLEPTAFGGLLLQSGSFFTPDLDPQEAGWTHFETVTDFVAEVLAARRVELPAHVAMTCGTAEENLANNRALRDHLRRVGVDVAWGEARQGHTWTCWRNLLDPHLRSLLNRCR